MDNEAFTTLKHKMTTMEIKYKLASPGNHISENAERSIQTFNNQFIAGIFSVNEEFHLKIWDRMLQQATMSLKFLQQSRLHPQLSAYSHLH